MNIRVQRMVDKYAGTSICLGLSLVHALHRRLFRPKAPARPQKILVILLSEMGSLVLAYPMFARLRERYPYAELYLLQFRKNRELSLILDLVKPENIFTIRDDAPHRLALDICRVLIRLRLSKMDAVIDCELFARIGSILSFLSGAAVRVGFHPHTQEGLYRGSFINRPVLYNPYRHVSRQFLTLAEAVESAQAAKTKTDWPSDLFRLPRLTPPDHVLREMQARLAAKTGNGASGLPEILIYPSGGILPIRAWPLANYTALCRRLLADNYTIGIIGLSSDRAMAAALMQALPDGGIFDLTGFTRSVAELLVLFHLARLLVTNDGGPGHFAALSPIATMIFFGPETPALYGSMDPNAVHFFAQTPCSPCLTAFNHRNSPCDGDNVCLKTVGVDEVHHRALALLTERDGRRDFQPSILEAASEAAGDAESARP